MAGPAVKKAGRENDDRLNEESMRTPAVKELRKHMLHHTDITKQAIQLSWHHYRGGTIVLPLSLSYFAQSCTHHAGIVVLPICNQPMDVKRIRIKLAA